MYRFFLEKPILKFFVVLYCIVLSLVLIIDRNPQISRSQSPCGRFFKHRSAITSRSRSVMPWSLVHYFCSCRNNHEIMCDLWKFNSSSRKIKQPCTIIVHCIGSFFHCKMIAIWWYNNIRKLIWLSDLESIKSLAQPYFTFLKQDGKSPLGHDLERKSRGFLLLSLMNKNYNGHLY